MKLVSYRDDGGRWRSGVLVGSLVVDAQKCAGDSLVPGAGSVKGILEGADATHAWGWLWCGVSLNSSGGKSPSKAGWATEPPSALRFPLPR